MLCCFSFLNFVLFVLKSKPQGISRGKIFFYPSTFLAGMNIFAQWLIIYRKESNQACNLSISIISFLQLSFWVCSIKSWFVEIEAVKHEAGFSVKNHYSQKNFVSFQGNQICCPFFMIMKEHNEGFCLLNCLSIYSICCKKMCFTFCDENLICVKTEQIPRLLYIQLNKPKFI